MDANEKKIFFESIQMDLLSVDYKKINTNIAAENLKIVIRDSYVLLNITSQGFELNYKRNVVFEPKSLFEIIVVYGIKFNFAQNTISEFENNMSELEELVKIKAEKAINLTGAISKASSLISSITMQNNGTPLVTIPSFVKAK